MTRPRDFDELAFDILLGLREGMRYRSTINALASKDRVTKEAAEYKIAADIAARLRRFGTWRIERRPPTHGFHPPRSTDSQSR